MATNRLDAGESAFFKRQLEVVKNATYDEKLAPLKYAQLLPIDSSAPAGATEITWRSFKAFGLAKVIADYATDFPRVDVGGTENTVKIKDIGVSYAYSIRDIQRSALTGTPLVAKKAMAARRAIEQSLNTIAWNGDAASNIQGFIKYPGTTEYTVPNTGSGATKTWSTKTPAQILVDLNGIVASIVEGTSGVEYPDTILLPITQLTLLKNTLLGTASDTTILKFFLDNNPGITIEWLKELDGRGTGGTDMFIAYKKDAEHLTFELPNAFEQQEEDKEGMEYQIPCTATTAGVIVYYPSAIAWGEGI